MTSLARAVCMTGTEYQHGLKPEPILLAEEVARPESIKVISWYISTRNFAKQTTSQLSGESATAMWPWQKHRNANVPLREPIGGGAVGIKLRHAGNSQL